LPKCFGVLRFSERIYIIKDYSVRSGKKKKNKNIKKREPQNGTHCIMIDKVDMRCLYICNYLSRQTETYI